MYNLINIETQQIITSAIEPIDCWQVNEGMAEWVENTPSLDELKQQKIAEINAKSALVITGGIISSALGEPHKYDTDIVDQINFRDAKDLCQDLHDDWDGTGDEPTVAYRIWNADGVTKGWYPHTITQFKQVQKDGAIVKGGTLLKASQLKTLVNNATTIEEVQEITWNV